MRRIYTVLIHYDDRRAQIITDQLHTSDLLSGKWQARFRYVIVFLV